MNRAVRLFIAINFPPAVRARLWDAATPLRTAGYPVRWVHADLVHLTVKFLGEVDSSRCEDVSSGLSVAVRGTRRFRLPVGGFGAFPSLKRPRVLWVGCEGLPVLELLHDSVERAMADLSFAIEGRMFRPHATIGRVARGVRPSEFRGLQEAIEGVEFYDEPPVTSLELMRSHLGGKGPRYERVAEVELEP